MVASDSANIGTAAEAILFTALWHSCVACIAATLPYFGGYGMVSTRWCVCASFIQGFCSACIMLAATHPFPHLPMAFGDTYKRGAVGGVTGVCYAIWDTRANSESISNEFICVDEPFVQASEFHHAASFSRKHFYDHSAYACAAFGT